MVERCNKCGFKIRGLNHEEGTHHRTGNREVRKAVDSSTSKRRQRGRVLQKKETVEA